MDDHKHDWAQARIDLPNGPVAGRRCTDCRVEITGTGATGTLGINAEVLRVAQRSNRALVEGLNELARRMR